jgi:hypothetical protein
MVFTELNECEELKRFAERQACSKQFDGIRIPGFAGPQRAQFQAPHGNCAIAQNLKALGVNPFHSRFPLRLWGSIGKRFCFVIILCIVCIRIFNGAFSGFPVQNNDNNYNNVDNHNKTDNYNNYNNMNINNIISIIKITPIIKVFVPF